MTAHKRGDRISQWLVQLKERVGWQKAVVALANKNARILWAVLAKGRVFDPNHVSIKPGEPASYYGAGASSFPGYNPAVNTGSYDRDSYAGYVNVIMEPTDAWLVDLAVRYEKYSDFGDQTIGKITSRYDINDIFAVRGTASTGFRAPTLGEGFYSAVNVSPTGANPQLQPNGAGAATLGFGAFAVKNRPARIGRNPRTGEQVDVGEKYVPQFKAGKEIRERLNKS